MVIIERIPVVNGSLGDCEGYGFIQLAPCSIFIFESVQYSGIGLCGSLVSSFRDWVEEIWSNLLPNNFNSKDYLICTIEWVIGAVVGAFFEAGTCHQRGRDGNHTEKPN